MAQTEKNFESIHSKTQGFPYLWDFNINDVTKSNNGNGGLILQDMFHDGYSFAMDLRTIGIWLFPKDTDQYQPVFLVLGPPDFDLVESNIPAKTPGTPPFNFSRYNSVLQLNVTYKSRQSFFGTNEPIQIVQKYLFTEYSDTPAHEPAGTMVTSLGKMLINAGMILPGGALMSLGALTATRVFPLITLQLPDEYEGLIESFRADYRIHPKLDGFTDKAQNQRNTAKYPNGLFDFPNQFGLFLDGMDPISDTFRGIIETAGAAKNLVTGGDINVAQAGFAAVEKPAVLEVCVTGMKDSRIGFESESPDPRENGQKRLHWDNIHWWGSRGKGNDIISAIGAFHTFHLHWRWGYAGQLAMWAPEFQGVEWWGPLVDPRIPTQTVRFAVVRYDAQRDPNLVSQRGLSKEHFSDLFIKPNQPPQEINQADQHNYEGANLVLWYSVEAKIPDGFQEGTVFIHGIFFAHENEPAYNPVTGSRTPEYWPQTTQDILKERKWYRSPHDF